MSFDNPGINTLLGLCREYAVMQLVKALRYKLEGGGFDS